MADPGQSKEAQTTPDDRSSRESGGEQAVRHQGRRQEPVFWGAHWTSARPAARLIGWGLGLLLAAGLPFFLGVRGMMNASMYSPNAGALWFALSGLMNLAGIIVLCMGTYRLARKADVAFLIIQGRYLADEKTHKD